MKRCFFLLLFFNVILVFSQLDSLQKKRWEEINKRFEELCTKDAKRATEDSKSQTIYYISIPAPNGEDFLPSKEFGEILKPYGIKFGGTWMGSDVAGYYTNNLCYKSSMTRFAEEKFGEIFFEDKMQEALATFIKNNPERVFDYRSESLSFSKNNFEIDFWNHFKLPKNYIKRAKNENFSKVYAYFIIDRNGKANDVEFESEFINLKNKKLEPQILASIKKQILAYKWNPNTYKGFAVKSKNTIAVTFP